MAVEPTNTSNDDETQARACDDYLPIEESLIDYDDDFGDTR